ncbi:MAG: hypothetical protein IJ479_06140 [Alphaproteobacteria bacterium]|nr:hypothetical protein [Alphaproteobacteria bacterium]
MTTFENIILRFFRQVQKAVFAAALFFCMLQPAAAEEISAIDFNGDLIGKVIPNGSVVGLDNQLIGNVTADSLIVNFDGKLIGGVVPQGVAVGNDTKLLGKVSNDGSVRLASGKIVGKTLPNGLVIDDTYNIIGAVLFPGLIYSDTGKTIGRFTGDGSFTTLDGQRVGFVSPSGDAYRKAVNDYILAGRLISSKMVVSPNGTFIGSVAPGGEVSDFDGKIIDSIRAGGFVYNDKNEIIGRIVRTGYAFDNRGKYLGFVSYNGEVLNGEKVVGRLRADGAIVDDKNNAVGYMLDFAATASDLKGQYLGRLMPEGLIASGKEIIGRVGPRGIVQDNEGRVVGSILTPGALFDYRGSLRGIALSNASLTDLSGSRIGYVKGTQGYDADGKIVGGVLSPALIIGSDNKSLGMVSIASSVKNGERDIVVSPYGYVFDNSETAVGQTRPLENLYSFNGAVVARLGLNGNVTNAGGTRLGSMTQSGIVLDERNRILGKNIAASFAVDGNGESLGLLTADNFVLDKNANIIAKLLPDTSAVKTNSDNSPELMPQTGSAYPFLPAVSVDGELMGYAGLDGVVRDKDGSSVGRVVENGGVIDNVNILSGRIINYGGAVTDKCASLGVLTPAAEIRNFRGVQIGRVLANGQIVGSNGKINGHMVELNGIVDNTGNVIGVTSVNGAAVNYNNENIGCVNAQGRLVKKGGEIAGRLIPYYPVMSFNDKIIGRSILDGRVADEDNQFIGYVQGNENVNSKTGNPIGELFRYQVAFDNANQYLGRVNAKGEVLNGRNEVVGQVAHDGYVWHNEQKAGYALYDFYVYDANFEAVGYISNSGEVMNFSNRKLGRINRGFLVDNDDKVIARGNRSYLLRNQDRVVVGELAMDGTVYDLNHKDLGKIDRLGQLKDDNKEILAYANPLQFYSPGSHQIVVDKDGRVIGYLNDNGELVDENGNVIGHRNKNGEIIGLNNEVIGKVPEKEKAYDANGNFVGYVNPDGTVENIDGKIIGKLDKDGTVLDASGNILGGIGVNWYEKTPEERIRRQQSGGKSDIRVGAIDEKVPGSADGGEYRKSFNIALTPDGDYLGDILEDGRVVDKKGNVLGRKLPDGIVIDDNGTMIGIEEIKKPQGGEIFVPAGEFGPGAAYGVGVGPGTNLGPGGGFGPGERYDPQRQYALGVAMNERRKNISVGKISSDFNREDFDGMQKDWTEQGIEQVISSWRVKMDEMILADKPIPAVIARSIDSSNPTPVTAIVERNVYAEEGRNILIPAGSRLIGTIDGVTSTNGERTSTSAKIQISWGRLIRPDGSIFVFNGLTGDAQGRGGALGYLDQQLFKRYSLPLMTTILSSTAAYYISTNEKNNGETENSKQEAANDARQNFLNSMDSIFNQILTDKASIQPMTYVPAGTRIIVYPQVDLWLRTQERAKDESARRLDDDIPLQVDSTNEERFKANYPAANNVQYKNTQNNAEVEEVPLMDDGGERARRKKEAYQPPAYYQPPVRPGGAPVVAPPGTGAGMSKAQVSNRPAVVTATTPQKTDSGAKKNDNTEPAAGVPQLF